MQRQIVIDGTAYKAVVRGKTYRTYRKLFGKDLLVEQDEARLRLVSLLGEEEAKAAEEDPEPLRTVGQVNIEALGEEFLERIVYAAIVAGGADVPEFDKFVDGIDNYMGFVEAGSTLFYDMLYQAIPTEKDLNPETTPDYVKKNNTN